MSPAEGGRELTNSYNSCASDSSDLSSSVDSLKSSGARAVDINSDALSTKTVLMMFSLSYLGMISTDSKSLSPADLDRLINVMKKHTSEKQREETSDGQKTAPVSKSPNLRVTTKVKQDIGPTISVVSVDESPRKSRANSFEAQKESLPSSSRSKKHSFDGTVAAIQHHEENGQHSEMVKSHSADTVDGMISLKSRTRHTASSADLPQRDVSLILNSKTITLKDSNDNKIIRKKKVTEIASCTQVSYAFSSDQGHNGGLNMRNTSWSVVH